MIKFKASNGYIYNFLKRNRIKKRVCTHFIQKVTDEVINIVKNFMIEIKQTMLRHLLYEVNNKKGLGNFFLFIEVFVNMEEIPFSMDATKIRPMIIKERKKEILPITTYLCCNRPILQRFG